MNPFRIERLRGPLVESVHRISLAAVDSSGRLVASGGNPDLITYWRSAAKPFQAFPLVRDGAAQRFGFTEDDLALGCASHSSEPAHLEGVARMLAKAGLDESLLACGPHTPLGPEVAKTVIRERTDMTPIWSNCSGKHVAMLALAKHHGWSLEGYQKAGHPVQNRILEELSQWLEMDVGSMTLAVDGCTAVCFGLPIREMAVAYARFGTSSDPVVRRFWDAMTRHPFLVAGTKRLCTELMQAWPGKLVAKVGAEGIYCAALPDLELGIAVKSEDGDVRAVGVALLTVIRALLGRDSRWRGIDDQLESLLADQSGPIHNTRHEVVGTVRVAGHLEMFRSATSKNG